MKLNYEVEWELDDEVIDNIVNEIEETINHYPDSDVDTCMQEITEDNLSDMDIYDCDHFNMDNYINDVVEEVKKRYYDQKKDETIPTVSIEGIHGGQIRRIDDLGRIVIPKDIRNILGVEVGEPFEFFFDNNHNIILKKYYG